jgi:hypothetical protein
MQFTLFKDTLHYVNTSVHAFKETKFTSVSLRRHTFSTSINPQRDTLYFSRTHITIRQRISPFLQRYINHRWLLTNRKLAERRWESKGNKFKTIIIMWLIDPLIGNDSVNTFPREPTRATIGRLLLCNGSVNMPKTIQDNRRRCFPWGPSRDCITRSSKGAVSCCQKLREFSWRRVHLSQL